MFFPFGLVVSVIRVLSNVWKVRTIPFVTNRMAVAIGIRAGSKEVVLGIWGGVFCKAILGKLVGILRKYGLCGRKCRLNITQATQTSAGYWS
jgi:hypothetical protein